MTNAEVIKTLRANYPDACYEQLREAVDAAIEALKAQDVTGDTISRQAAIDELGVGVELLKRVLDDTDIVGAERKKYEWGLNLIESYISDIKALPSAELEIIRCKDCEYGKQDEVGRWFCRSLGCQIGNEDGSGYCADAERRTDETD